MGPHFCEDPRVVGTRTTRKSRTCGPRVWDMYVATVGGRFGKRNGNNAVEKDEKRAAKIAQIEPVI